MNATAECNCPFNGECFTPKIIYIFLIMQITTKFYFGLADTPLKGTKTIQGTLTMKSMRMAPSWLNISSNQNAISSISPSNTQ